MASSREILSAGACAAEEAAGANGFCRPKLTRGKAKETEARAKYSFMNNTSRAENAATEITGGRPRV